MADDGEPCCEAAVPPTCYIARNDEDKGGKDDQWMVISLEAHKLMNDFLLIRESHFRQNMPDIVCRIEGGCHVFLNSVGTSPSETSNFRLNLFNRAVYGDSTEIVVTPQMLRSWNSTFLHNHPDAHVRSMRGAATGNTENVFEQHYNLTRQAGVMKAMLTTLKHHNSDQNCGVSFSQENQQRRQRDQAAIDEANAALLSIPEAVDITSQRHPISPILQQRFREELEMVSPGLWQRAGTRADGLTEMAWIKELLNVLGKEDAEQLCEVVFEQYRGDENPAKRQWSGLRSHVTAMAKEKERGVEPARY